MATGTSFHKALLGLPSLRYKAHTNHDGRQLAGRLCCFCAVARCVVNDSLRFNQLVRHLESVVFCKLRLPFLAYNIKFNLINISDVYRLRIVKTNDYLYKRTPAKIKAVTIAVSIVEDDASTRGILAEWIRGEDEFKCVGVHENAETALTKLPQEKPSVVLMDINMPGVSGIECVRCLKPKMMGTQFVMLTVYEDSDHIFKALSSGASGYLLKRTPRADLIAAIKDVHAGGSPMSSNIARKIVQSYQRFNNFPSDGLGNLSPREREALELLARGYLYKEISDTLHISVPTVNTHIRHIYEKLHVRSRSQAVAKFTFIPNTIADD